MFRQAPDHVITVDCHPYHRPAYLKGNEKPWNMDMMRPEFAVCPFDDLGTGAPSRGYPLFEVTNGPVSTGEAWLESQLLG